ncbi:MAG: hypothetical protein WDN26_07155 [Chitinophagaceae bacterium]
MIKFDSIETLHTPFSELKEVGVLLFSYYPTTIVYVDQNNNPIIKEWVDCTSDNSTDRHFYFKTSKGFLKQFLVGEISHLDLINYSLDGLVFFQDSTGNLLSPFSVVSVKEIPLSYKPTPAFKFDKIDGVDTDAIFKYFNLDEIETKKPTLAIVKNISQTSNSEILYVHINRGKGVSHGSINTEVFGKTLVNFDRFYKSIALDTILTTNRGEIHLDAEVNKKYLPFTETVVDHHRIAASFGFLIKPIVTQASLFEQTQSEIIATRVFELINRSKVKETLKDEYMLHSGYTINSYRQFLDGIVKCHLNIDLNWFNPVNRKEIGDNLSYIDANRIVYEIDSLSKIDNKEFKAKGKFRAVNCDTAHFTFVTLNEDQYTGYFDKLVKDLIEDINFIDIYEILISRKIITEATKKDDKIVDTIMSYYIDTE